MTSLAGIDFSINSACVCTYINGEYSWKHFGREKTKYFNLGNKHFDQWVSPKREKGIDYCATERMKLDDAQSLCREITFHLSSMQVTHIAFEGHSFNSKGNSLLELVSYQFLLRDRCNRELNMPLSNMFFYSPISVKAFAGGAKFKKKDLLHKFIETEGETLRKNDVFIHIAMGMAEIVKGEDVKKPVDDVIDSYWIVKKLHQDVQLNDTQEQAK